MYLYHPLLQSCDSTVLETETVLVVPLGNSSTFPYPAFPLPTCDALACTDQRERERKKLLRPLLGKRCRRGVGDVRSLVVDGEKYIGRVAAE